jgi:hypothetical protein
MAVAQYSLWGMTRRPKRASLGVQELGESEAEQWFVVRRAASASSTQDEL